MVTAGVFVMGTLKICKSDVPRQSCWSEHNETKNVAQLEGSVGSLGRDT